MKSAHRLLLGTAMLAAAGTLRAELPFDAYIPATPKTVLSGSVNANSAPAVKIKSGQTVKIDVLNSTELNKADYAAVLTTAGIPLTAPFYKETLEVLSIERPVVGNTGRLGRLLTGPVFVEEAEPGDTLEVRVLDVVVQSDHGINRTITNMGHPLATMTPAPTARVYPIDRAARKVRFSRNIEIPLWPYLGEMGVAPAEDSVTYAGNRPSRLYGGSLDTPDLGKGASIYFPVQSAGGLFVAGGGKAVGANGKVNFFALEVPVTAYLQFIVHKGKAAPAVRAETPTHFVTFGTADMLDVVMRLSALELVDFLKEKGELDFFFAYSLGCLAVDFNIARANTTGQLMAVMTPKHIFIQDKAEYWYKGELAPKYYLPGNHEYPGKQFISYKQFLPETATASATGL